MHICFVTTGDIKLIATAKRALGLANPLIEKGWKISIILEDASENRHRVSLECTSKVHVYYFKKNNAINEIIEKNKIIREICPDFLYICSLVPRNMVFYNKAIKLVEHCELVTGMNVGFPSKLKFYILEYFSIFYSDGILNASAYLYKVYQRRSLKLFRKNLPMLYFPYAYSEKICQNTVKEVNLKRKADGKYFVYLGSLDENYGVFTMLHAFELLNSEDKHCHLVLLGKGAAYTKVCQYVKEKNIEEYIHIQGYVPEEDISAYFTFTDAFISPMNDTIQDWARCPSKLYMYLPYKKPVITCKIGEPHLVLKDKGFYYTPGSSESLKNTIIDLLNSENWSLDINPLLHCWKQRGEELNVWLTKYFVK